MLQRLEVFKKHKQFKINIYYTYYKPDPVQSHFKSSLIYAFLNQY